MLEWIHADIVEDDLAGLDKNLLGILLKDRSSRKNIIWATDDYASLGEHYQRTSEITPESITGEHTFLIQPRTSKPQQEQQSRIRNKGEVFTPSWICNRQNNLIDEAWFGRKDVFNIAEGISWTATDPAIPFPPKGRRSWKRYVDAKRLEISCGEAPYIASRYDSTTGEMISLPQRVGLLDRKLRVVGENTAGKEEWLTWAIRAVQSVYGYEFQGDSLFLARENIFMTFLEYYSDRFNELPDTLVMKQVARIISWNLWQMDGLSCVIPFSCEPKISSELTLFGEKKYEEPCPGCEYGDSFKHTGIYCKIHDWRAKASVRFVDMMKGR